MKSARGPCLSCRTGPTTPALKTVSSLSLLALLPSYEKNKDFAVGVAVAFGVILSFAKPLAISRLL